MVRLLNVDDIKHEVSACTGVPIHLIDGHVRAASLVRARHLAMYLARKYTTLSYPELGEAFGRHHTTILEACRSGIDKDTLLPHLEKRLERLSKRLMVAQ